jgi:hypothetical protein
MANSDFQLTFCCIGERSLWIRLIYWASVASHLKEKEKASDSECVEFAPKNTRDTRKRPSLKPGCAKHPNSGRKKGSKNLKSRMLDALAASSMSPMDFFLGAMRSDLLDPKTRAAGAALPAPSTQSNSQAGISFPSAGTALPTRSQDSGGPPTS